MFEGKDFDREAWDERMRPGGGGGGLIKLFIKL